MASLITNFMMRDLVGVFVANLLFTTIFLFPGYITGWSLDVFSFRTRTTTMQIVFALAISSMIMPAFLFLFYWLSSPRIIIFFLCLTGILSCATFFYSLKGRKAGLVTSGWKIHHKKIILTFVILWGIFSAITLVNLQIDHRLYFSNNAYDLTTRVSIVDAISRTGVPPINPSFYPGRPAELNFVYHFWYIICSLVDQMGGGIVSSYDAMIASISWTGLLLFSTTATYLRIRNNHIEAKQISKKFLIAVQLFAISGLDSIALSILLPIFRRYQGYLPFQGGVEGWNMPVTSWLNAIAWAPHHVVATLACMLAIPMLQQIGKETSIFGKFKYTVLISLGFASALGLSFWVMVIFGIFWIVWGLQLSVVKKLRQPLIWMGLASATAVLIAMPFWYSLLNSPTHPSNPGLPVAFFIRPFFHNALLTGMSDYLSNSLNLILLPLNYIFEFGFFFLVAILWVQRRSELNREDSPILDAEFILVIVTTITLSLIYSKLGTTNDFGIRGWLPMQFILVVWASDLILPIMKTKTLLQLKLFSSFEKTNLFGKFIGIFWVVGLLTTTLEFVSIRTWSILVDLNVTGPHNGVSLDTNLGERTYDARLAYEYLQANTMPDVIVQNNPSINLDRPAGLYGSRQMVIADRTAYGVSAYTFSQLSRNITSIFTNPASDWNFIDTICKSYFIDYIIINDSDPLWKNIQILKSSRNPFYQNDRYIIFPCVESVP